MFTLAKLSRTKVITCLIWLDTCSVNICEVLGQVLITALYYSMVQVLYSVLFLQCRRERDIWRQYNNNINVSLGIDTVKSSCKLYTIIESFKVICLSYYTRQH